MTDEPREHHEPEHHEPEHHEPEHHEPRPEVYRESHAEERRRELESERHYEDVSKALLGDDQEPEYPDDADTR